MANKVEGAVLRYPGSKWKARDLLHRLAPVGYKEYREPFFGSGAVATGVPDDIPMWVRDLNPLLFSFWEWFRDSDDAVEEMTTTAVQLASDVEKAKPTFLEAREMLRRNGCPFSYWICNRYAASAIVSLKRKDIAAFGSAYKRNGMSQITRPRLEWMRRFLRRPNMRLELGDYRELLHAPGDNCWIFLDPPYLLNAHNSPLYEFFFTHKQHLELADALRQCPHQWLLTVGDSPLMRRLYRGYRIEHRRYTGSMPHRAQDMFKTELIISNY